jgi:hypothetical protein
VVGGSVQNWNDLDKNNTKRIGRIRLKITGAWIAVLFRPGNEKIANIALQAANMTSPDLQVSQGENRGRMLSYHTERLLHVRLILHGRRVKNELDQDLKSGK